MGNFSRHVLSRQPRLLTLGPVDNSLTVEKSVAPGDRDRGDDTLFRFTIDGVRGIVQEVANTNDTHKLGEFSGTRTSPCLHVGYLLRAH
jgi:hypothetical protein